MNKIIVGLALISLGALTFFWMSVPLRPTCEIMAIGTVHAQHQKSEGYELKIIYNLIKNFSPERIFIEITKDNLEKNNWSDSSPEMKFIENIAKNLGIEIISIDIELSESSFNNINVRDLRTKLQASVGGFSFKEIHRDEVSDLLKNYYLEREGLLGNDNIYAQREKLMDEIILKNIKESKRPTKWMSFTGYTHLGHIKSEIKDHCEMTSPNDDYLKDHESSSYDEIISLTKKEWENTLNQLKKSEGNERKIKRIEAFL